jgi:hypothetical protein
MTISSLKFSAFNANGSRDQYQFMLGQKKAALTKREDASQNAIFARPIAKVPPVAQPPIYSRPIAKLPPVIQPPIVEKPIAQLPPPIAEAPIEPIGILPPVIENEKLKPVFANPIGILKDDAYKNDSYLKLGRNRINGFVASNNPTSADQPIKEGRPPKLPPIIEGGDFVVPKPLFANLPAKYDPIDYVPVNDDPVSVPVNQLA